MTCSFANGEDLSITPTAISVLSEMEGSIVLVGMEGPPRGRGTVYGESKVAWGHGLLGVRRETKIS